MLQYRIDNVFKINNYVRNGYRINYWWIYTYNFWSNIFINVVPFWKFYRRNSWHLDYL